MANYEFTDNVGAWFFHALIESAKLDGMAIAEEATHQNKPRASMEFASTYTMDSQGEGTFLTISAFQREYSVLLFGVHVVDTDGFAGSTHSENLFFPTGPGIGPFLRTPVMTICPSAFAIPDANNGRTWQTADVTAATDESGVSNWLLASIGKPYVADGYDNFRLGMNLDFRVAGFDGQTALNSAGANSNYYLFWHATGAVAAYL